MTWILWTLSILLSSGAHAATLKTPTALLVDKKTNTLTVAETIDGTYKVIKKFHATLGQVKGDKLDEGDLKTPEGIYTFKSLSKPPQLKAKFGAMAFYLNFPNPFDTIAGRTGSNIMLHATNLPERLKKDFDSEGCVVVNNDEIQEIAPSIRLGMTPILIFENLSEHEAEYLNPGKDQNLKNFFQSWIQSWESKNIESYVTHYHSDFSANGMDRDHWKKFKSTLNQMYVSISVGPESVIYYRHPKYSMITFTQNYQSKVKGGGWGHRSRGSKILYVAEEGGAPKIIAETYSQLNW